MAFPNFHVLKEEGGEDFCDSYKLACITSRNDTDEMRLRAFALVMKGEAKVWLSSLTKAQKETTAGLKEAFLARYRKTQIPKEWWM